jgi:hypothetical protein
MCDVCCEKFNLSTRKQVSCPYCPFKFCRECCSQFLLNSPDEPSCMNCKKPWGREVLADSFTQVWMNTTYRSKRESILYERERSLMPATQHLVEKEKKIRTLNRENIEYEKEMSKNHMEISKIHARLHTNDEDVMLRYNGSQQLAEHNAVLQVKINYNNSRINYIRNTNTDKIQKRNFVRACPGAECRGFLSSAWKCGLCEVWVCPDCHEIKGTERDVAHTCDPGNLETARLLDKDSKPCPNCASMIFKIHGCDQMYCTQCNTAFSWHTGRIEKNRIHNPHYYEYLRQRAGSENIRREIGDIPCGGMPYAEHISHRLNLRNYHDAVRTTLYTAARGVIHIENVALLRYRVNRVGDNEDMRIKFMIGDFDEDEFKRQLQVREHQTERKNAIAAVLNTYVVVASEIFRKLVGTAPGNDIDLVFFKECLAELEEIRTFTNQAMERTSKLYKRCAVPLIGVDYSTS